MSRKAYYTILTCLLCLLPTLSFTQSLTRLEYWFDDAFSNRKTISLSGSTYLVSTSISTQGLDNGTHKLNFRVRRSDGMYSPVSTTLFYKLQISAGETLEYWIDDDEANRTVLEGNLSESQDAYIYITEIDVSQLTHGVHRLNYLVRHSGSSVSSAVFSTPFFKMPVGSASMLEYWFDDDETNRTVLEGNLSSTQDAYIYSTDIDASALAVGFHRLNFRACNSGGDVSSAVSSASIFKMPTGNASILEYWIDDDFKSRKRFTGSVMADGYMFTKQLDFGSITPGAHRLSVRAKNSNGKQITAISSVPIIVKSRYSDANALAEATLESYTISVDGGEAEAYDIQQPTKEIVQPYLLDARTLSQGNHIVKMTFWNSYGAGVSEQSTFKIAPNETPTLTLTAQEDNGLVKLTFDALPNDLRYRIGRIDENGAKAKVDSKEGSSYPGTVTFTDNPPAGTYTYYVQTAYTDFNGEPHSLTSNEVTVNVAKAQTEVVAAEEFGYIIGRITCDKKTPMSGLKIRFSDGETANVSATLFQRMKILKNTELTMTVEGDEAHEYEPVTVKVEAGSNMVTLHGILREEYQPNNLDHDLAICSSLQTMVEDGQHHAKFKVKNLSKQNKWEGYVMIKAVSKSYAPIQLWMGTIPTYHGKTYLQEVRPNAETDVDIIIEDLELRKDTQFELYLESEGRWKRTNVDDREELKVLATTTGFGFPMVKTINKTEQTLQDWNNEAREVFSYMMLGLSSVTPGMDSAFGDFQSYMYKEKMILFAQTYYKKTSPTEAINAMFEWLSKKSLLEAINDWRAFTYTSAGYGIFTELKNIVLPQTSILQKFRKDIIVKTTDIVAASSMISTMIDLSKAVTGKNTFEQIMSCSSILYRIGASGNPVPLSSMMYTYMVAGRTLINAALELQGIVHDDELAERLMSNEPRKAPKKGLLADNVPSYNTTCDFKLIVETSGWFGGPINFKKGAHQRQIKDIVVQASNTTTLTKFLFDLEYFDDGIMLKLKERNSVENPSGIKPIYSTGGGSLKLNTFFMEIHWTNDRVTYIPLNTACSGIDIKPGDRGPYFDNEDMKPSLYTVTLTTTTGEDKMADELYLGNNRKRE